MTVAKWIMGLGCGAIAVGFWACGANDTPTEDETSTTTDVSWSDDVKPIVDKRCATAGCHDGTQPPNWANVTKDGFLQTASKTDTQVSQGLMPEAGSDEAAAFTDDEKNTILEFVRQ